MAQTKRKRRSKHRGNAVGSIESRGRTGRRLTEDEREAAGAAGTKGAKAAGSRQDRWDVAPT